MMFLTLIVAYGISQMLEWIFRDWITVTAISAYLIAELRLYCSDNDTTDSK